MRGEPLNARPTRLVAAAAAVIALAACSSTTSGQGSGGRTSTAGGTQDFPSNTTPAPSTAPATGSTGPTGGSTTKPVPAAPLRTATVHGSHGTYVIKVWAQVHTATCADHAYGTPVVNYLKANPCGGLDRLLATTVVDGHRVGFAQSTLGFRGVDPQVYEVAGNFRALVTKDGTGNLDDLLPRRVPAAERPPAVPSPDAFSALSQDAGVTVVDAWYLDRVDPGE